MDLGERKIIGLILKRLKPMPNMPIPFGDDVSAVEIGNRKLAVLKTDMLVGTTDVPSGMSLFQTARKAVVMTISDFAAKGVKPIALLAAVGVPRKFDASNIRKIGKGLNTGKVARLNAIAKDFLAGFYFNLGNLRQICPAITDIA